MDSQMDSKQLEKSRWKTSCKYRSYYKILYNFVNKNKNIFKVEFVHVRAAHDYNEPKDKSSIEWINWNGNNNADLLAKAGGQQIFGKQIGITKLNIFEISKNL